MLDSEITAEVRAEAVKIFEGMEQIIRNEMLVRGVYITEEVVDPALAKSGAICGGHQACMVGSMWIAADVRMERDDEGFLDLPGVAAGRVRNEFLAERPALRLAYETMNELSRQFAEEHNLMKYVDYREAWGMMEGLYESHSHDFKPLVTDEELLEMLEKAKAVVA